MLKDQNRPQVRVEKLPYSDPEDESKTHCWVPSHQGKVIEFNGQPCFSVGDAKYAASRTLGHRISGIDFEIVK